jgi:hypothetical protein
MKKRDKIKPTVLSSKEKYKLITRLRKVISIACEHPYSRFWTEIADCCQIVIQTVEEQL